MWFIKVMKNGFNFSDRARRKEYWCFVLATFIISIFIAVIQNVIFGVSFANPEVELNAGDFLGLIFNLIILIPSIAVTTRRLHDINKSGWWQLIYFLPILGIFIMLYFLIKGGDKESNRFGDSPIIYEKV